MVAASTVYLFTPPLRDTDAASSALDCKHCCSQHPGGSAPGRLQRVLQDAHPGGKCWAEGRRRLSLSPYCHIAFQNGCTVYTPSSSEPGFPPPCILTSTPQEEVISPLPWAVGPSSQGPVQLRLEDIVNFKCLHIIPSWPVSPAWNESSFHNSLPVSHEWDQET